MLRRKRFAVAGWLTVALAALPAKAQTVLEVTLDDALRLFNDHNLELRLARSEARAVFGDARHAGAFPNPTSAFSHERVGGAGLSYSETYFTLRQPVPFPWVRSARRDAAAAAVRVAAAQVAADSNRIQADVKRSMVRAIAAERRIALIDEVVGVVRAIESAATTRYAAGDLSGYDLRRARIALARHEQSAGGARLERDRARRFLTAALLPEAHDTILQPADFLSRTPPAFDTGVPTDRALTRRPEAAGRREAAVASQASLREIRGGRWADQIALSGGYKRQSDGQDGVFLAAELPLPVWNRRGGAVAAADARVTAAEERARLIARVIRQDVRAAWSAYTDVADRVGRIEPALYDTTDDLLTIAQASYAEGEIDLLDLLDAADVYLSSRTDHVALRAELWDRYFDLERAVGGFDTAPPTRGDRE